MLSSLVCALLLVSVAEATYSCIPPPKRDMTVIEMLSATDQYLSCINDTSVLSGALGRCENHTETMLGEYRMCNATSRTLAGSLGECEAFANELMISLGVCNATSKTLAGSLDECEVTADELLISLGACNATVIVKTNSLYACEDAADGLLISLDARTADLETCISSNNLTSSLLSACNGSLINYSFLLGSCEADSAVQTKELAVCIANLANCSAELLNCNAEIVIASNAGDHTDITSDECDSKLQELNNTVVQLQAVIENYTRYTAQPLDAQHPSTPWYFTTVHLVVWASAATLFVIGVVHVVRRKKQRRRTIITTARNVRASKNAETPDTAQITTGPTQTISCDACIPDHIVVSRINQV